MRPCCPRRASSPASDDLPLTHESALLEVARTRDDISDQERGRERENVHSLVYRVRLAKFGYKFSAHSTVTLSLYSSCSTAVAIPRLTYSPYTYQHLGGHRRGDLCRARSAWSKSAHRSFALASRALNSAAVYAPRRSAAGVAASRSGAWVADAAMTSCSSSSSSSSRVYEGTAARALARGRASSPPSISEPTHPHTPPAAPSPNA